MPQMNPITLTSDETHSTTYAPRGIDTNGVASFVSSSGVPIADKRITISRSRVASSGREKVAVKMTIPVVVAATVNGVSTQQIQRVAYVDISFSFDKTSTTDERQTIRRELGDLIAGNGREPFPLAALVDELDTLY